MPDKIKLSMPKIPEYTFPIPDYDVLIKSISQTHHRTVFNSLKESMENQFAETNRILERQLEHAVTEAESAKRDARLSKIISIVSLVVAVISAIAAVMALF